MATAAHHGVVDRTSAAWLHGLTRDVSSPVTLSVPRSGHGSAYCAVETTVRRRSFPAEDLTRVRGVPTTGLALTVLAASSAMKDGIAMMDRALQKKVVTLGELRAALNRNSGAYGMAQAREILTSAEDLSESELERKFVRFLQRRRISGWKQQEWVGDRRMDFVWPAEQVAVSLHGWAFHRSHDRWERDQETTNMLIGLRWLPLIFTWKRLTYSPDDVFRELTTAIDQRQIAA
ncbi:endonuclease domain-containing protein [Gordonia spumicola]|uniref:endonuclease domain-containing protein n=1 Tax=Gordonia spumicola TaxID=589161 RepID=UPI001E5217EC|nr:hypothetical protein [Gordonia spumicola]